MNIRLIAAGFATMTMVSMAACTSTKTGGGTSTSTSSGTTGAGGGMTGSQCVAAADCVPGQICQAGECLDQPGGCISDADCPDNQVCDGATGECAGSGGCKSDTDCNPDETCDAATGSCKSACHRCACEDLMSMGGCADQCTMGKNGSMAPNFCDGMPALSQCATCLAANCALFQIDPTDPTACQ